MRSSRTQAHTYSYNLVVFCIYSAYLISTYPFNIILCLHSPIKALNRRFISFWKVFVKYTPTYTHTLVITYYRLLVLFCAPVFVRSASTYILARANIVTVSCKSEKKVNRYEKYSFHLRTSYYKRLLFSFQYRRVENLVALKKNIGTREDFLKQLKDALIRVPKYVCIIHAK